MVVVDVCVRLCVVVFVWCCFVVHCSCLCVQDDDDVDDGGLANLLAGEGLKVKSKAAAAPAVVEAAPQCTTNNTQAHTTSGHERWSM